MNELMNQSFTDTSHLTPIEIALGVDENGMTTAKKLYDFLELAKGQFSRWAKTNILDNPFAEEGVDYWGFDINVEGNVTQDYRITSHFAKKLSMKGNGKKAEDAREYFTKVEDGAKQMVLRMQEMSPQLQVMINMELEQKRQAKEQERQAAELKEVKENQRTIAQALIKPAEVDFRTWVNSCLSAIAESEGYLYIGSVQERHRAVRTESYERLNRKRPCRLDLKVKNAKGNAAIAGANDSQLNAINKLTVIEKDKDLRPVYEAVIREMLAAYRVNI
jgi:anti-repressor protein